VSDGASRSRIAVCEPVLRLGSLAADLAAATATGVAGLGVSGVEVGQVGAERARALLADAGITASSHMSGGPILDTAPRLDTDVAIDVAIEQAAALGAPGVVVRTGPLGGLSVAEADARCREWLVEQGRVAADHGVHLALEPVFPLLRDFSYVHTLEHALRLVSGVDGAGVCVDLGHLWWDPGLVDTVAHGLDRVVTVQVTDVDAAALAQLRYDRAALGQGDVHVRELVQGLEGAGYRGWYEIEVLVRIPRDERVALVRDARLFLESVLET